MFEPRETLDKFPEYDPKTNLVYMPKTDHFLYDYNRRKENEKNNGQEIKYQDLKKLDLL